MDNLKSANDLAELCALQWRRCVERSLDDFEDIPQGRVFRVAYEALVREREEYTSRIARFLDLDPKVLSESPYLADIGAGSIGKGYSTMPRDVVERVLERIEPTMERLGYR